MTGVQTCALPILNTRSILVLRKSAIDRVSPTQNIRDIPFVVIVGGSALDFEIPQLVTEALSQHAIVAGRGNVRGLVGPRNAVATGLILTYVREKWGADCGISLY